MTYEEYSALGEAEKIAASVAPCGLICELCSERSHCKGCNSASKMRSSAAAFSGNAVMKRALRAAGSA